MRVLHVVGSMNLGGQETFIMNVYRKINKEKIQFDFAVSSKNEGYYDSEIRDLGGKIYYIPAIKENLIKRCFALYKLIVANSYTVLHRHSAFSIAFVDLFVGWLAGVKTRIIHSHADYDPHRLHPLFRPLIMLFSNCRLACSIEAARWMYGKCTKSFVILNNGIDTNSFLFNPTTREKIRSDLGLEDSCILLGHTGRFSPEKNHRFLFDLLAQIINDGYNNIKLCLVGDGEAKQDFLAYCKEKQISQNVIFCGLKDNVNDYLSAFDIFLFPSIHEGLGISLIEAEINGLKCIVSENINQEAFLSERVSALPLNIAVWEKKILSASKDVTHQNIFSIRATSFDVRETVRKLMEIYGLK